MPLTVGSRGRPPIRKPRGKPTTRQTQRQKDAAAAMAELSDVGSAISNYSTTRPPPLQQALPKRKKNRTLAMMEEMVQAVRASEKRCTEMSQVVNSKLAELHVNRESIGRAIPPSVSTPNATANGHSFDRDFGEIEEDFDWGAPPPPQSRQARRRRQQACTSSRALIQDGARANVKSPTTKTDSRHDIIDDTPTTSRKAANNPSVAAEEALQLIAAAAQNKTVIAARKKGIPADYMFPYDLIERGDSGKTIKKGESTREEYMLGLIRLMIHPAFPSADIKPLTLHIAAVAKDNCKLPWQVVRRYSEETFSQIADGRIPTGWQDITAIINIRVEN